MSFKSVMEDIRQNLNDEREKVRKAFVEGAYGIHRGLIVKWYTGRKGNEGLNRRTGAAANSWGVRTTKNTSSLIEVSIFSAGVPHADRSGGPNWIRPKKKKWLAIPAGDGNVTSSGKPRYYTPAEAEESLLFSTVKARRGRGFSRDRLTFYKKDHNTAFLFAAKGVRGPGLTKDKRLLFVLKKAVRNPKYTKGLFPWVEAQADKVEQRLLK